LGTACNEKHENKSKDKFVYVCKRNILLLPEIQEKDKESNEKIVDDSVINKLYAFHAAYKNNICCVIFIIFAHIIFLKLCIYQHEIVKYCLPNRNPHHFFYSTELPFLCSLLICQPNKYQLCSKVVYRNPHQIYRRSCQSKKFKWPSLPIVCTKSTSWD
jgi:hypothetical protein